VAVPFKRHPPFPADLGKFAPSDSPHLSKAQAADAGSFSVAKFGLPGHFGQAKLQALATCEFALGPENCSSLLGYITGKTFNAFFAGCIPIYQGYPEATRWIPPEAFLPMERFRSGAQLAQFLRAMTREEKEAYLGAGARFLKGGATEFFDVHKYVDVFWRHLESALPESKARPAADFQR
jgi:hypothetical protein